MDSPGTEPKKSSRRSLGGSTRNALKTLRKSFTKDDKVMSESSLDISAPRKFVSEKSVKSELTTSLDSQQMGGDVVAVQRTSSQEKDVEKSQLETTSSPNTNAQSTVVSDDNWRPFESYATVIHTFEPAPKTQYQIPLKLGEKVSIIEETLYWYRGVSLSTNRKGIFPKSYVHLCQKLYEAADPVLEELSVALWEWTGLLKSYYKDFKMREFENMKQRLSIMIDWNSKIRSPSTEESVKVSLKNRVIDKIEEGRRFMGLDVIIRQADGARCTERNTGIIDLLQKHIHITERDEQKKDEKKSKQKNGAMDCMLLLDFKLFACSVGEPTEVFCSLWRADTNSFITEDFVVTLTAQGMPVEVDRIGYIKAVFKDMLTTDFETGNLYLYIRLVRKGKLEKKGKIEYRIPYGGSLVLLKDLSEKETEHCLPIYTTNDANYYNLPELILKQKDVSLMQKAKGIFIGLTLLEGLYVNQKDNLYKVSPTEKYGFPEIILPGASRNDFYLTIESADCNFDKTVEVVISVKMSCGNTPDDILPDCLRLGTSEAMVTTFHSTILYHVNNPRWSERISLLIPPGVYEHCHVYFEIRTASANTSKEVGFGFLSLNKEDGTVIDDGHHEIKLYKMPKHEDAQQLSYLTDQSKLILRKEVLHVNTLLCSTALTQYSYVRSLLKWRQQQQNLPEILNRLTFGSQFEIIKFFQEIFDAMFQILDAQIEGVGTLVYDAIIFVIVILVDEKTSRFTNFRPVLETYISRLFQSSSAYVTLLRVWKQYLDNLDTIKPNNILSTLKATTYLLKIIKKSLRVKNGNDYNPATDESLKSTLHSLFNSLNELMTKSLPVFIGAQAIALKNLPSWFDELFDVFSPIELSTIAVNFINSIPRENLKTKIRMGKLSVLSTLLNGKLFQDKGSRRNLLPLIFDHLHWHMANYTEISELATCYEIISDSLVFLHKLTQEEENQKKVSPSPNSSHSPSPQSNVKNITQRFNEPQANNTTNQYAVNSNRFMKANSMNISSNNNINKGNVNNNNNNNNLQSNRASVSSSPPGNNASVLAQLVNLLPLISKTVEVLKDHKVFWTSVTCYLNIYHLINPNQFHIWLEKFTLPDRLEFISKQSELIYWFCAGKTYPKNWFSLKMFQISVVKKILFIVSTALTSLKGAGDISSHHLNFFQSAFAFLDSEVLKLDIFSPSKQALILEYYGDMRLSVCTLIKNLWNKVDTQHFARNLIKEFLKISVINQVELKELGVKLYFSALEREYKLVKSFKGIEGQTIEAFSMSVGTSSSFTFFFSTLEKYIEASHSKEFVEIASKFLSDMKELCLHLIALNKSQKGQNEDDRTIATLSLMEYLKESNRIGTYIRYVHSLVEQHSRSNNYLKAGLTLLLHTSLLSWSSDVKAELQKESDLEKKISLYEKAIKYFDQSEAWEQAIELSNELYQKYQYLTFDYLKAAELLEKQSEMTRKMLSQERLSCEYFRVGFYGNFASNLRNKEFIYCGSQLERIGEFTERILSKFDSPVLLKSTEPPSEAIRNGDEKCVQIFSVKPEPDENDLSKSHPNIPSRLKDYRIAMYNVNKFVYKRPFSKDKNLRKENEFRDLWTMNYYYYTKETFPVITSRSEICEVKEVEVTPLQNAIHSIKSKNDDILKLSEQYKDAKKDSNISPLTMVLSGTVDAAVSGGLDNYKLAFLCDDFISSNPEQRLEVETLKQLFQDHVVMLAKGIAVHAAICPDSLTQLQIHMEEKLEKLKEAWHTPSSSSTTNTGGLTSASDPKLSNSLDSEKKLTSSADNEDDAIFEPSILSSSPSSSSSPSPSPSSSPSVPQSKFSELDKTWGSSPKMPSSSNILTANSTAHNLKFGSPRKSLIGHRLNDE